MKIIKEILRIIICFLVTYLIAGILEIFLVYVFNFNDEYFQGLFVGGLSIGLTSYYYHRRKIRSLLIKYDNEYEDYLSLKRKFKE